MKGWIMIHRIKSMYDNGSGSSIRAISKNLGISRNTVRRYLRMTEPEITEYLENKEREKYLDKYRSFIIHLLNKYPKLSSAKIMRKLTEKDPLLSISYRSLRRYVSSLKNEVNQLQARYYEPIIDMVPGCQCQVDPGEMRNVRVGENEQTIYFAVFVLSFSRLMYVSASEIPLNTEKFIKMHNEAFCYFEGVTQECVYDQTKMVALSEEFREVNYNESFLKYATASGFDVRVCEGFDPESKGKVESGVKYVKNNFFYGEEFTSFNDLKERLSDWFKNIANRRIHGTTGCVPLEEFEQREKDSMKPYLKPETLKIKSKGEIRKVDKTSLISWKSVKYSVPSPYQKGIVLVYEENGELKIQDKNTLEVIAKHTLCSEKNRIIKNINHYRDYRKSDTEREKELYDLLGSETGKSLCHVLKKSSPKIYKDQLTGLIKVLTKACVTKELCEYLDQLSKRPYLTTSMIRDHIYAFLAKKKRRIKDTCQSSTKLDLSAYGGIKPDKEIMYDIL